MANRCDEEFNPWPSFVDIFSSVILVLLLFLLVTIVSIGYYAQFKFKVSYTGSITTDEIILSEDSTELKVEELKKQENQSKQIQQQNTTQSVQATQDQKIFNPLDITMVDPKVDVNLSVSDKLIISPKNKVEKDTPYDLEKPGTDFYEQFNDNTKSDQKTILKEDTFILTFKEKEIFADDVNIAQMRKFIKDMINKYGEINVYINAIDPQKVISATIAKQISLGRTLSARNLVRKFGIDKNKIKIDLQNNYRDDIQTDYGHIVIRVEKR